MLIVEQRNSIMTAPVFTYNSNVALEKAPAESYLSGERMLALAVVTGEQPEAALLLVSAFIATRNQWQLSALLNYLDTEDLQGTQIVISTEQANYWLFNGQIKKTVVKALVIASAPRFANFLYQRLGLSAELTVALYTAIRTGTLPRSSTRIILSKGFLDPSRWDNHFGIFKTLWVVTRKLLALPFKSIYS